MNKNKNIFYIIIGFLLFLILVLFILLFLPEKDVDSEKYLVQDYINVDTNLIEEEKIVYEDVESTLNFNEIQNTLDSMDTPGVYAGDDLEERMAADIESAKKYENEEGIVFYNENVYANNKTNVIDYGVSEDYVEQFVEINYYPEDCLHLINKKTDLTDLEISESNEKPIINSLDAYGTEGFFRIFEVYNIKTNEREDSIAINLVTGEMFGYTPEGILYDFDFHRRNPDYEKNIDEMFKNGETVQPYNTFDLWNVVRRKVSSERYGQAKLNHLKHDGIHYYKVYWDDLSDYYLFNYYTGEMFQVVDGIKTSDITFSPE